MYNVLKGTNTASTFSLKSEGQEDIKGTTIFESILRIHGGNLSTVFLWVITWPSNRLF
jgi:hypothetical protein